MGYITNQWLGRGTGPTVRRRSFSVEKVDISAGKYDDSRSMCIAVRAVVEITASRGRQYQAMYLELEEAEGAVESLVGACSDDVRAKLAAQILKGMTDAKLLEVLAAALKGRPTKEATAK